MKEYIDFILRNAERAKDAFRNYLGECHDYHLVVDAHYLLTAFLSARDVVAVYYRHWYSEFTVRQVHRFDALFRYDAHSAYEKYLKRYV